MLKMKRFLATAMAMTMMLSSTAMFASALEITEEGQTIDPIQVKAQTAGINPGEKVYAEDEFAVYAVDMDWDDMAFTYTFTEWDPENLVYKGEWDKTSAEIRVSNRSNLDIDVNAKFDREDIAAFKNVELGLDKAKVTLPAATDGQAHGDKFTLGITNGVPTAALAETSLGTITASIAGVTRPDPLADVTLSLSGWGAEGEYGYDNDYALGTTTLTVKRDGVVVPDSEYTTTWELLDEKGVPMSESWGIITSQTNTTLNYAITPAYYDDYYYSTYRKPYESWEAGYSRFTIRATITMDGTQKTIEEAMSSCMAA